MLFKRSFRTLKNFFKKSNIILSHARLDSGLRGKIDSFNGYILEGWVVPEDENSDLLIEIAVKNLIIGHSKNNLYREDVINAGITNHDCGFRIYLKDPSLEKLYKSEIRCNGVRNDDFTNDFHELVKATENDHFAEASYRGYVDAFDNYILRGWIISDNSDDDVLIEVVLNNKSIAYSYNTHLRDDVISAGITQRNSGFEINLIEVSLIDLHNSEVRCNGIRHGAFTKSLHDFLYEIDKKNRQLTFKNNSKDSLIDLEKFYSAEIQAKNWRQFSKRIISSNDSIQSSIDIERFYKELDDELYLSSIIHRKNGLDIDSKKPLFADKAKLTFEDDIKKFDILFDFQKDEHIDVTVVLVLFNKAELTYRCLKSLNNLESQPKIVVIDNASTDKSSELISKCKGITYIKNKDNKGFIKACNQARSFIDTKYILLLNNDSVIEQHAIDEAICTFEKYHNVGVVGGKILHLDGMLQEAGSIIYNDGSCLGYGRRQSSHLPQYNFTRDVDFVSGAFFLTTTSLWDKTKGFDEIYYPYYYEEVDFCMRIKSLGYRIIYEPKSVITHFEYGSSTDSNYAINQMKKNKQIFFNKHKKELETHYDTNIKSIDIAALKGIKPNLLYVEDQIPFDEMGSGFPRSRRILLELKKYYNVIVLPFNQNNFFKKCIEYEDVMLMRAESDDDINTINRIMDTIEKVWIGRPHNIQKFISLGLYEKALQSNVKIIYDAEAIFSEREKIRCELFDQKFDAHDQNKEISLLQYADLVVSVSDKEKMIFANYIDEDKQIFKVSHPMSLKNATYKNFKNREDILFIGNMTGDKFHSPNVDSIYYFMNLFGETLKKANIPIRLIGAIDKQHQDKWESLGAICEGQVDNLQPFFDKALISIAPTRFAAGIPHKVHESLASGVPVMYSKLISSQVSKNIIEDALIENLNHELLTNKNKLESIFNQQIKECSFDMSEDEFQMTIKKISEYQ